MAGAIGDVREVHVWTNRPLGYWPQGIPRPAPMSGDESKLRWNNEGVATRLAAAMGKFPVPDGLSWDLFLGVAPVVEYHPVYHPFNWRGWVDWGQGALGDMGAHLVDHPVWGLELGLPTSIETIATPFNGATYPNATTTYYEFPARGALPGVKMTWYDGGLTPARPEEVGDEKLNGEGGVLYVGSKGKMLQDTYGLNPRLLPMSLHESYGTPPQTLPRITHEEHEMNWVEAIKGQAEISCPFEYAAQLTEVMLLGIASLRANEKLHYDGAACRITGSVAPEFAATTLDGEPVTLSDYAGKVVLLNIWATWCLPCREEMPSMQRLYESMKGQPGAEDFEILAVSIDAPLMQRDLSGNLGGDLRAFKKEFDLTFPILHDPSGEIRQLYQTTAVPESFVIDKDGVIIKKVAGEQEWDAPVNRELVRRLLAQ